MSEIENTQNIETNISAGADEDLIELGRASRETRGLFWGIAAEISLIPWRLI